MKKQLSAILLGTSLFLASVANPLSVSASTASFKDMKGHWAESSVKQASEKGFIGGYSDNTFRPKNLVTRAEFATFLSRAIKVDTKTTKEPFTDVADFFWAKHSIEKGIALGFIKPSEYANNKFEPNKAMTRAEIARWLVNGLESANPAYKDVRITLASSPHTLIPIPEFYKNQVKKTDLPYIGVTMGTGLLGGYNDGTFKPNGTTTRAEVAAILLRLTKTIENNPGTFEGLKELLEVSQTGSNVVSITDYKYTDSNSTFKDILNETITYKNSLGTGHIKRIIFVDSSNANNGSSIYKRMFVDKNTWFPSNGYKYFIEMEFTSQKNNISYLTFLNGNTQPMLYTQRVSSNTVIANSKINTLPESNFESFFTKGQPRSFWFEHHISRNPQHSYENSHYIKVDSNKTVRIVKGL